ncbi:MAG: tetratricopeptide repeat protein [bacterium]|nr:tetratricopeptide repeat protein [bacterium]
MSFWNTLFGKPKTAKYYNKQAIKLIQKGRFDEAISMCNEAIALDAGYTDAYNNRGLAYAQKNEYDRAIADFNKALEINPRLGETYYNKALTCEKAGRTLDAIEGYKKAIEFGAKQNPFILDRAKQHIADLEKELKQ